MERIIHDNKQFVTIGPRYTPCKGGECTDRLPYSGIRLVDTAGKVPPYDTHTASDIDAESNDRGVSFDTTVQITRVGFDDNQNVGSEESNGTLDYDPNACIAACQYVSMGVRYDAQLIDRILQLHRILVDGSRPPLLQKSCTRKMDGNKIHRILQCTGRSTGRSTGKRYADDREVVAGIGPHQIQPVSRILQVFTATYADMGTLVDLGPGPCLEHQYDCAALNYRALIDTGAETNTTHLKYILHKFQNLSFEKYMSDAGDIQHHSIGFGYLKIVTNDDNGAPN
jgi:hypothetical protein